MDKYICLILVEFVGIIFYVFVVCLFLFGVEVSIVFLVGVLQGCVYVCFIFGLGKIRYMSFVIINIIEGCRKCIKLLYNVIV